MRRILELSPSTTWVVSSLSSLLASSLLSSPLDLSIVITRRRYPPGCSLLWSMSQIVSSLMKMSRRVSDPNIYLFIYNNVNTLGSQFPKVHTYLHCTVDCDTMINSVLLHYYEVTGTGHYSQIFVV